MTEIILTIPVVPVPKARHRTAHLPNGKTIAYNGQKARGDVETFIAYARPYFPDKPLDGALAVSVDVFLPIPSSWSKKKKNAAINGQIQPMTSRSDIDNYLKFLFDVLNGAVYVDDHQICEVTAKKKYSESPRWEISISKIEGAL